MLRFVYQVSQAAMNSDGSPHRWTIYPIDAGPRIGLISIRVEADTWADTEKWPLSAVAEALRFLADEIEKSDQGATNE